MRPDWVYGKNLAWPVANPTIGQTKQSTTGQVNSIQQNQSFADLLQTKLQDKPNSAEKQNNQPLQFSKHAVERLQSRSIQISTDQMKRIEQGIDQIAQKGGKDSLVICGNVSLVVNVPNRTVVTAMDINGSNNHVFTQIDSAVIV